MLFATGLLDTASGNREEEIEGSVLSVEKGVETP